MKKYFFFTQVVNTLRRINEKKIRLIIYNDIFSINLNKEFWWPIIIVDLLIVKA
jgi:hypothetical protein